MSLEDNKRLVRDFIRAQNEGNVAALEDLMAPDFVDHSVLPGQGSSRDAYIQGAVEDQAAFSDAELIVEEQLAEGDKVMTRLSVRGLHDKAAFTDMAPTGAMLDTTAITINRVVGDKIAAEWSEGTGMYELTRHRLDQELKERERIEQELRLARRIQQALLPKELPQLGGWDIVPYYRPAREVGGDFYDFLPLKDGNIGLVIGDVSGKGIAAALVMANTQSVLRTVVQTNEAPGQALRQTNEVLWNYIPPNMFVTCFYGILDPTSGRLVFANAGHNPPCCLNQNGVTDLLATGMPLGLMSGMVYEEKETILLPEDGVLFYSDGLVEAHNSQREMLGSSRLRNLMTDGVPGASDLTAKVIEELGRFTGEDWVQEDDLTLVALQRLATVSPA
jgi:serine phosphatase RsbU (regulator of sigma subunit)/ketosteroid isomerase-like protein